MSEFARCLRRDCRRSSGPSRLPMRLPIRAQVMNKLPIEKLGLQPLDFRFQFSHSPLQVRQPIERCREFHPQTAVHRRGSSNDRARRQIARKSSLAVDYAAVADGEVARTGGLARKNAIRADFRGAGEADLAAEHGVGADARGVTDEHEVIQFCAAGDAGLADGRAIHAGVGLHFDVVFEDRGAGLQHFVPGAIFLLGEAEPVSTDNDAVLQDDAIANAAEFANDGVSVREEIVADLRAAINCNGAVKHGVAPDVSVFVDETVRADVRVIPDARAFRDDGGRMDSRSVLRWFIEKLDGVGKCKVGIGRAERGERWQRRVSSERYALFDEDRGSARRLEKREVAAIREEGKLTGFGLLDSRDTADFDVGWAFQAAAQFLRNFGKFHGAAPQTVLAQVASLAQGQEGSTGGLDYSLNRRG